jgi:hypothetical protein
MRHIWSATAYLVDIRVVICYTCTYEELLLYKSRVEKMALWLEEKDDAICCRRSENTVNNIFISSEHVLTLSFVHSLLALHIVISIAKKDFKAVTS